MSSYLTNTMISKMQCSVKPTVNILFIKGYYCQQFPSFCSNAWPGVQDKWSW